MTFKRYFYKAVKFQKLRKAYDAFNNSDDICTKLNIVREQKRSWRT